MTDFSVIIPARMGSERLPGKPLCELAGRPMIERVQSSAWGSGAGRVIVATDDERVATVARDAGGEGVITRDDHPTGTDRIAEVVDIMGLADDAIVVNLQGDEPLMPPAFLSKVATDLASHTDSAVASLATSLNRELVDDPNYVKVITDHLGYAMYFSRAAVPSSRDGSHGVAGQTPWLRHLGIYAYRAGFLRRFPDLQVPAMETLERLEQLRALWHGYRIHMTRVQEGPEPGVDTAEDLQRVAHHFVTE